MIQGKESMNNCGYHGFTIVDFYCVTLTSILVQRQLTSMVIFLSSAQCSVWHIINVQLVFIE